VLQEAQDKKVPLLERLRFLAIYSSNLDEFFRVKVAAIRSLNEDDSNTKLDFDPSQLLRDILRIVNIQQNEFGQTYRNVILPELNKEGIYLLRDVDIKEKYLGTATLLFKEKVLPLLKISKIRFYGKATFLENRKIYLLFPTKKLPEKDTLVVEIPSTETGRFVKLGESEGKVDIAFIDDIIRVCFPEEHQVNYLTGEAYSVKLSRDAELNIEDEFSGSLVKKIKRSLKKRADGTPARLLYDEKCPKSLVNIIRNVWELSPNDMVPGARYHNFSDFFDFPKLVNRPDLLYPELPKIPVRWLEGTNSYFKILNNRDVLLHYPYHSYDYFINFLNQAADSESISDIKITLYRVAKESRVCQALIRAAKKGKKVTAFFEVKARFDEASNLFWSEELKKAGCIVLYSFPGLKVHAKLCLITRRKGNQTKRYAYLSTGNFNENTAQVYTDFGLLTSDKKLTTEASQVFEMLEDMRKRFDFHHLLVAPDKMRNRIYELIDKEIINHLSGKPAGIVLKMNGIDDIDMIEKLYYASGFGVPVRIVNRGICRLIPGYPGVSESIHITSIVDRFLEHHRLYWFKNGGDDLYYLSSADFMNRNLSRRIEVGFPILSEELKVRLNDIITMYLNDNTKARVIDSNHLNEYVSTLDSEEVINSQTLIWKYYEERYQMYLNQEK
jgi:polyphosphate kinase